MSAPPADDITRLRGALAEIHRASRELRWADERPWSPATHVRWEGELPVIDLHDLNARLARDAVRVLLEHPAEAGAVVVIHGRGRNTIGPTSVLRNVVHKELRRRCQQTPGWSYRLIGAGRTVWISDRSRAPAVVTGRLGWGFWLFVIGLAAAAIAPFLLG